MPRGPAGGQYMRHRSRLLLRASTWDGRCYLSQNDAPSLIAAALAPAPIRSTEPCRGRHEHSGRQAEPDVMGPLYSHMTQARLALSAAAKGVSDQARGLVSADDRGSGAGEIVERAVQLVDDARAVLARAVVYEREQGASWQTIGRRLASAGRPLTNDSRRSSGGEGRAPPARRRGPARRPACGADSGRRGGPRAVGRSAGPVGDPAPGPCRPRHRRAPGVRPARAAEPAAGGRGTPPRRPGADQSRSLPRRAVRLCERKAVLLEQIAAADPDDPAAGQAATAARRQVKEARRRAYGG
jgi:hypothetical protein